MTFFNIRENQLIKGSEKLICSESKFRKALNHTPNYMNLKHSYFGKYVTRGTVMVKCGEYAYKIKYREEHGWITDFEILYAIKVA